MRLVASLFSGCWIPLQEAPTRYAWRGLIQRRFLSRSQQMPVPFGWCAIKEWDFGSTLVMPLWLAFFYVVRRDCKWRTYAALWRCGLCEVGENDYWSSGHWRAPNWLWCFLHDRDARMS